MKQAVRVAEAQELVLGCVQPVGVEKVALLEALHRVTAEEVTAQRHIPLEDNSAMDGYAVRHTDVAGATRDHPAVLEVLEILPAGKSPRHRIAPGTTVTWVTVSGSHTTTSNTGLWDSGEERLPVGESYSFTFQQPGVYDYYCRPHRNAGMIGRVIVSTAGKGMSDMAPREALETAPAQQTIVE